MKKKIKLIGLLFFVFVGLNAQTPYFYYYGGTRQYLELDTRYIFISAANENTVDKIFPANNAKFDPFRIDIPEGKRSRINQNRRFWSVLNFEDRVSDNTPFYCKIIVQTIFEKHKLRFAKLALKGLECSIPTLSLVARVFINFPCVCSVANGISIWFVHSKSSIIPK